MEITPTAVFPLPTIARNPTADCFAGVVTHDGKMMLALSPEGLCPNSLASTIKPLPTAPSLETMYKVADFAAKTRTVPKVLVFSTATDQAVTFGLSLSQVAQVMQPPPILAVPGSADYRGWRDRDCLPVVSGAISTSGRFHRGRGEKGQLRKLLA